MKKLVLTFAFAVLSFVAAHAQTYVNGYYNSKGTYVQPHYRSNTNTTNWDNYSTTPNYNPYTGGQGYKAQDYSQGAYNYGKGQQIQTGSRGGQYYYNSNGNKVYVPKRSGY